MGHASNQAGCCTVGERDYVIGPIRDAEQLLDRLNSTAGRTYTWGEVFIDAEEGAKLFPEKSNWQDESVYPALRIDVTDERLPCKFLGENGLCTIHDIRSDTCRNYSCGFLEDITEKF